MNARISQGCIEFQGGKGKKGYGYTQFMGRQYLAHRLAYALNEWLHPAALKGLVIRHRCDNPSCINVEHLEPGTTQDNVNDKVARGRHLFGELVGNSKLTAAQVAEILATYRPRSKDASQHALARKFGVSQAAISFVISGRNWPHMQPKEPQ